MSPRSPLACIVRVVSVLALASFAAPASAQVWNEVGDAGQDITFAQITVGAGSLTQINGTLSDAYDVDIYCVQVGPAVDVPGLPVFSLQCVANQGPNIWVFDANGYGVAMNETCQAGGKTLTNNLVPTNSVTLYVAVSYYGMEALTGAGAIWQTGVVGEHAPDGPDFSAPLVGFLGIPIVQPINPYTITVGTSGIATSFCESPVPAQPESWGGLKTRYR